MTEKAPPAPRSGKVDPGKYNELVAHATLQGLRLTSSNLQVRPEALDAPRGGWVYRVSDTLEEWNLDCEALRLRGLFAYTVACAEGRRKPVTLRATYYATYALSKPCEETPALAYLRRVGRYSCYPYFRALFGILTEQGGLQLPPLPVLHEGPRWIRPE